MLPKFRNAVRALPLQIKAREEPNPADQTLPYFVCVVSDVLVVSGISGPILKVTVSFSFG